MARRRGWDSQLPVMPTIGPERLNAYGASRLPELIPHSSFLECLGERNHGLADFGVGKRGEPYQNTLNIAPPQNDRAMLSTSTPHPAARTAAVVTMAGVGECLTVAAGCR